MVTKEQVIRLLLVTLSVKSASAFAPSTVVSSSATQQNHYSWGTPTTTRSRSSRPSALLASSNFLLSEIFLLSFDGTVAQTTEYRIDVGLDLAFAAWPHLRDLNVIASAEANSNNSTGTSNSDTTTSQHEWLRNKMRALSHVLVARPGVSLTCDYALLVRLLIEEQELDGSRSNGSRGKYGSKFHPQTPSSSNSTSPLSSSSSESAPRQTRPLTVGEIAVNWNKGGCLGETLLTRYHVNYKNPLPMLQEKLEELMAEKDYNTPDIHNAFIDILEHSSGNLIITLGHPSDLPMAMKALAVATSFVPLDTCVMAVGDERLLRRDDVDDRSTNTRTVKLLPIRSSKTATFENVLKHAPSSSTVYIFDSSWHALEESIALFGDNIPRSNGRAKTILGRDLWLSLNFPAWSSPSGFSGNTQGSSSSDSDISLDGSAGLGQATQQNEALMNAWTNLVNENEMSELLSARIIGS